MTADYSSLLVSIRHPAHDEWPIAFTLSRYVKERVPGFCILRVRVPLDVEFSDPRVDPGPNDIADSLDPHSFEPCRPPGRCNLDSAGVVHLGFETDDDGTTVNSFLGTSSPKVRCPRNWGSSSSS